MSDVDAATRDAIRAAVRAAIEPSWVTEDDTWDDVAGRITEAIAPVVAAALERVEAERDAANARILAQHRRIVELEVDGRRLFSQVVEERDAKAEVVTERDRLAVLYERACDERLIVDDHELCEREARRLATRCSTLTDALRAGIAMQRRGVSSYGREWADSATAVLAASDTPTGDTT